MLNLFKAIKTKVQAIYTFVMEYEIDQTCYDTDDMELADIKKLPENQRTGKMLYYLGRCYYYGKGVVQDYKKAAMYWHKGAELGDSDAQFNLGCCYYYGEGVKRDYEEASHWWSKAEEQGNTQVIAALYALKYA